ncbi:hypothetical protein TUM19329_01810 [Legionella antarctica]|uniref:EAL domain-containing protein n=2 Tax=Legionella antarctica TaxID=2708020 RepID=A0A6F8T0Y7_9GAMM|nr:hypothetical protein TUM19329_01810 [Legionella antarctica]
MAKDAKSAKIVEAIIKLMNTLALDTTANGISDEITLERLKELGCRYGQEIYFSRAVDADQFTILLSKKSTSG